MEAIRRIAARGSEAAAARNHYTYRQTVLFQELDARGGVAGSYREVRDIIFSPQRERSEVFVGRPVENLKNMRLTEEDHRDVRDVQPFVITGENLFHYQARYQGREKMEEADCYVFRLTPRQELDGQRLFDGLIWASVAGHDVVRAEGRPVPQIYRRQRENLFPHFTTVYRPVDGKHWFPVRTIAEDTLFFRSGPQKVRLVIRFDDYKRFSVDSTIQYQK